MPALLLAALGGAAASLSFSCGGGGDDDGGAITTAGCASAYAIVDVSSGAPLLASSGVLALRASDSLTLTLANGGLAPRGDAPTRYAGADPVLGPTDFHAYVEVYLSGGWYIFDPSGTAIPMGFVRFGTGRDAADVSFATIFGPIVHKHSMYHRKLGKRPYFYNQY